MFHTKICGVRRPDDIDAVAAAGADAIGLNFFPGSMRYVDPDATLTKTLASASLAAGLLRVGLFVNHSVDDILRIVTAVEIDMIQLHGDESVAMVGELMSRTNLPLLRAIKLPGGPLTVESIASWTFPWEDVGCHLLLDADHGGSGRTIDWKAVRQWALASPGVTWALAGGLNPQNVAQAILESGADSVDTASGVEQRAGEKSSQLIHEFVRERLKAAN